MEERERVREMEGKARWKVRGCIALNESGMNE